MAILSRSIVVIACGNRHMLLKDKFDDESLFYVDLTTLLLKDPATSIGHKEDGSHKQTQQVVFMQKEFANVMETLIYAVYDDPKIKVVIPKCRTGYHRADVISRCFGNCVNSMSISGGHRFAYCLRFNANELYGKKGATQMLKSINDWLEDPWDMNDAMMPAKHLRYGHDACRQNRGAWDSFEGTWGIIEFLDGTTPPKLSQVLVHEPRKRKERAPDEEDGCDDGDKPSSGLNRPKEPRVSEQRGLKLQPKQPPHAPGSKGASSSVVENLPPAPPAPPRSQRWVSAIEEQYYDAEVDAGWGNVDEEVTETIIDDQSVKGGYITKLKRCGCDETAIDALTMLYDHSEQGKSAANELMAKVVNKMYHGTVGDVSKFIHKCSMNARSKIQSHFY
jgi:hypothetical protein